MPNYFGKLSHRNYYTCLEYVNFTDECIKLPQTKARISNHKAYVNGMSYSIMEQAQVPIMEYPSNCSNVNIQLKNDWSYVIEAGGQVVR